jgi:hypothetical protein
MTCTMSSNSRYRLTLTAMSPLRRAAQATSWKRVFRSISTATTSPWRNPASRR